MNLSQIAIQLFTLREHLRTPEEVRRTLRRVSDIGYQAIQVSGMCAIAEEELVAIASNEGLRICATHEPASQIRQEPERVVERLQRLGCHHAAFPHAPGVNWSKKADIDHLIGDLDHAGSVLRDAGQTLSYHNHGIEFTHVDGITALDYIFDKTHEENVKAEIDTYWVQYGGGDPAAWCRKLDGRLPLLHIKDYVFTLENKPAFGSIGSGNLNWTEIIQAAESSQCEWFIVEQDVTPGDPFQAILQSLEFIKAELIADRGVLCAGANNQ